MRMPVITICIGSLIPCPCVGYRDRLEQKVTICNECTYGGEMECAGGKRKRQSSSQETDKAGVASVF